MITEGNFRLTGLKQNDITPEIENIIRRAQDLILICGYSFTNHRNPRSVLKMVIDSPIQSKHCIFPINLYRGRDANRIRAIELIRNGVSVSIENKNHSKWIMSENEIYYGSANFSMDSLENKIEVATFRTFKNNDNLRSEFLNFIQNSMDRMLLGSNRSKLRGVIGKNEQLTRATRGLIKRFNPSIEKVMETVDSINIVRSLILEVVENCFWHLNEEGYNRLAESADFLDSILNKINHKGNDLINTNEGLRNFKSKVYYYNYYCNKFLSNVVELSGFSRDLLFSEEKVPRFTTLNRKLVRANSDVIETFKRTRIS